MVNCLLKRAVKVCVQKVAFSEDPWQSLVVDGHDLQCCVKRILPLGIPSRFAGRPGPWIWRSGLFKVFSAKLCLQAGT